MSIHPRFKANAFSILLCWVSLASTIGLSQVAQADESWISLLKPLVSSVIMPAVNTRLDQLEARMQRKSSQRSINTSTKAATGTSSTTTSSLDSIFTPSSSTTAEDWKLPDEPTH